MPAQTVNIIGAGLGGLAAAIRLAARGVRVKVFERNSTVGGKVNIHTSGGYTFDTGASLLTMRHVVADLFESAGRRLEDYLELEPLEPICRYLWPDGAQLDASTDIARTEAGIRKIAPADAEGFRRFLADARRKYEVAERTFLAHSLNDLPRLLRPRYARDLAALSSMRTLSAHVASYFRSPSLRQLFNRFATYNGSSPYRAPATFALIPHVEFGLGAWYVRGGMYQLPTALARLAGELGVELRTGAEVERIIVRAGRVRGVGLASGEVHECDALVANTDASETYLRLLEPEARGTAVARRLARGEPSCSGFVVLAGTRRRYEHLAHHNIFFSSDYRAEFDAIFKDLRPAREPTVYVCATSRTDASQAPAGHENLFVLVNAPATSDRTRWDSEKDAYRDSVMRRLESFGLTDLRASVDYEHVITPADFQSIYHAHRGSIYGLSSNSLMSAFLRPPNRARHLRGLYLAGGTTHPGGGIPLVLLSGKMAAELLIRDEGGGMSKKRFID
ncbi:MAG TPA: phytoene desaturase family protein [Pyrinomonadaceae bacterium]|jgi:phytoene desaturase|nr:phytoene desaturase family protein [Pyrinomonadaceae bacterium]